MNSTFKVVFNKARGALMVVNEITLCVQAKGTQTVVAAAVATMIAGVASTAIASGNTPAEATTPTITVTQDENSTNQIKDVAEFKGYTTTAVIVQSGNHVFKTGVKFNGNTTTNDGAAILVNGGSITLDSATFTDNEATGSSKKSSLGGAIHMWGGQVTAKNVTYSGNKSLDHNGGAVSISTGTYTQTGGSMTENYARKNGGAFALNDACTHTISLTDVDVSNNKAGNGGAGFIFGGTHTFKDTTFSNNSANGWGGAFYVKDGSTLNFEVSDGKDFVYENNKAAMNKEDNVFKNYGRGGDFMYVEGSNSVANFNVEGSLTIKEGILSKNSALNKNGKGTLITSDMTGFVGNLAVNAGKMVIESGIAEFDINAQIRVNGGNSGKATLAPTKITVSDKAELYMQAGVKVNHEIVFENNGTLTLDSLTVTSTEYAQRKTPSEGQSRAKQKYVGKVTFVGDATITNGLAVEKKATDSEDLREIVINAPTARAGTTIVTVGGTSKNEGKISGTGTLRLAEGASFVNEGLVSVSNLTLDGAYTSMYGTDAASGKAATKGTDSTVVTLNKGAKFIDKNIPTAGITIGEGKTVNFNGGNFYKDENTAFEGALSIKGTAKFDGGDYKYSTLSADNAAAHITVAKGSLTISDALKSVASSDITVQEEGAIYIPAAKVGFTTATDGKITYTAKGDLKEKITNDGKIVLTGLTGEIAKADLKVKEDLVRAGKGLVDLGAVTITEFNKIEGNKIKQSELVDGVAVDQLKNVTVTDIADGGNVNSGSFGAVVLTKPTGTTTLVGGKVAGTLELNNGNGLIVSYNDGSATKLDVAGTLRTTGTDAKIGEITGTGNLQVVEGSLASDSYTGTDGKKAFHDITIGKLIVAEGASLESLGTVKLTADGDIDGSVNIGKLDATGITVKLQGSAKIEDLVAGQVNVGNALKAGNAVFGTVSGTVFADPAWENSTEHSNVAVDKVASSGTVEIGQNSLGVIGSRDIKVAQAALDKTGHVIAKSGDKAVNSAVLVLGQKDAKGAAVAIEGTVFASNATTGPTTGAGNGTAAGSLMIIDASTLGTGNAAVFKEAVDNAGILYLANVKAGDKIKITEGALTLGTGSTGVFESDAGRLLTVAPTTTGGATLAVDLDETKVAAFEGLSTLDTIVDMYKTGAYNSASAKFNKFLMDNDNGMTTADIIAVGNDAAMLGATAAVGSVTMDAISAFNDTLAGRTSILAQRGEGVNVWADVYGGHNEAKKLMDGRGYKSDVYGGVLGADTVVNGFTIGAALTIGTGDTDSANTLVKSSTDSDFVGFSVYGAKAFGSFNVAADLGYMQGSNDVSVKSFGIGDFSADTSAFTMGVRGEYMVDAGSFKIVPHAGLRFTHLTTDDFEAAYTTDFDDMNIFQAPVGVTVAGSFEASGWNLAPMLDLSIVPAFGDKDADMTLGIAGVATKTALSTQIIDSNPVQMTLGLSAQKDAWTFGLNWKLGAGSDDRMNNTFNATVNYAF